MNKLIDKKLSDYINEVDSSSSAPGGGSVMGVVGSLACALAGMVGHLTINKKVFKELSKDHTVIIITHKKEVMNKADHLIIIDKGKKVADGSPKSLENNKYYLNLRDSSSVSNNNI